MDQNKFNLSAPKTIYQQASSTWSPTKKLAFTALMAAFAALLQSAGGYLPGIGLIISPLTTLPIVLAVIVSPRFGFIAYVITIILLLLIEPSELFIFPYTTGLLGLSLGLGFLGFEKRWMMISFSGSFLFLGICFPLYVLGFPVFGAIAVSVSLPALTMIAGFSFLYSWLWIELGLFFIRRLEKVLLPPL